ncbi:MAG: SusD/RagB family nutrient-binding outer membrane lipoprotein [Hydrotalea flava]|uniref:SusD/RagB family nutrient-binding outer membrane lipoprotein n=1 Tax=Hydrotalea TaxID=1004300 RepID=UPI0010260247|nr:MULTISPECIES: SusD/RagB family nutrient-binding outer membrane lipoprotein [Hydrotalea]NIM35641.1 SusD/RagB family nutrient-binding outer membrane lipoprotein [Hydrotalea flava]NIM38500.1 SusD/RagB family nutrient-binding outer membrane lipoprotein [Hydrotalea flava]NIN03652.1 SusD/RagB family nutrient-binding outer membrane lipoprotein [Hydrotalea flava]NIN15357.1 SusD/RagB family nutrient-binding outer membrane lipoprotein [Hydrotalea flava]NIO94426.1 SusD/RagB family nutrient-binding out
MKQIKNISLFLLGVLLLASCTKKIQELQADPNKPTSVPAGLILGTVLTDMAGNGSAGSLGGLNSWNNVHNWNQYFCNNYDYYGNNIYSWTNGSFDPYLVLKNVVQMEREAVVKGASSVNPYEAVGRFIRAYYFYNLTSLFGDVPLTQALQGSANPTPSYTQQQQVFAYILNQLDTANTHFATLIANNDQTLSASQDLFYQGNLSKWQKLVNAFKLRVLIQLSSKTSDATLNVAAQFANIVNNPSKYPIFTSQADDMAAKYDATYLQYPFNPSNFGSIAQRNNMADTYVKALTTINDPRVFVTCEPAWALVGSDTLQPAKFQYFVGASTGLPLSIMYGNASANLYSFPNRKRYYSTFTGEPDVLVGFKEQNFNIAEGIERGWVSGNAESYYKTGIIESMKFYGIDVTQPGFNAYFLPPGKTSTTQVTPYNVSFNFANYYAQPAVQLSSNPATAIQQIVLQKYIAMFQNSGYEAYYNWRRTGVPAFEGGSGVGNNGIIPIRWAYPVSEQAQNAANWKTALQSQQFSADDLNQKMWLLK